MYWWFLDILACNSCARARFSNTFVRYAVLLIAGNDWLYGRLDIRLAFTWICKLSQWRMNCIHKCSSYLRLQERFHVSATETLMRRITILLVYLSYRRRFYRLVFPIILPVSVSPYLHEGQAWVRNPQCQPIFYSAKSYFRLATCSTQRSITTKVSDDFGILK